MLIEKNQITNRKVYELSLVAVSGKVMERDWKRQYSAEFIVD